MLYVLSKPPIFIYFSIFIYKKRVLFLVSLVMVILELGK